jgi:hypothetical protein
MSLANQPAQLVQKRIAMFQRNAFSVAYCLTVYFFCTPDLQACSGKGGLVADLLALAVPI